MAKTKKDNKEVKGEKKKCGIIIPITQNKTF